jgi:hypothetical protein
MYLFTKSAPNQAAAIVVFCVSPPVDKMRDRPFAE